jgi:hypothetical protein
MLMAKRLERSENTTEGSKPGQINMQIQLQVCEPINTVGSGSVYMMSRSRRSMLYDVFDNDIFINRVDLEPEQGYFIYFVEDKLVAVNRENNNIKVFEY